MTELLLAVLTLLSDPSEPTVAQPVVDPVVDEDVLVRRAHLPVMFERTRLPGSCSPDSLDPSDIDLRVDGQRVRVTTIDRKPQPRTHALVLDTSESMKGRLEVTKQVAKDYIDGLPEEDAVLLASFDETFVLRCPLGMERDVIKHRVESLDLGFATGLWDAVHRLALYLDTVPGEKVVILLSDGEDSSSVDSSGTRTLALVRQLPDLVVFPIAIALSPDADAGPAIARSQLAGLAQTTGGRFFETQTADGLPRVFREIRKRLAERVFLSYVPGEPTSKRPKNRRIKANLRPGVPCKVQILGPPQLEGRRRIALANEVEISRIEARASREGLVGRVNDLVLERGPLFTSRSIREGKPRVTLDRAPEFEVRDFEVLTPPIHEVVNLLDTPEKLLLYLLEHAPPSPANDQDDTRAMPAWLVHGRTMIHMRTSISRALFERYPDYREWAGERIERVTDRRLEHMVRTVPDIRALSPAGLAYLRKALRRQEAEPELGAVPALLTEWLGDLSAHETVLALERITVNALLAAPDAARDPQAVAELLLHSWDRLLEWFPPPVGARVVAPLLPAYSPARDAIGFYRFVLPRPDPNGPLVDALPRHPLALQTTLWLGREELVGRFGAAPTYVQAVEYRTVRDDDPLANDCPLPDRGGKIKPIAKVRIDLASDPSAPALTLVAYFHEDRAEPSCLAVGETMAGNREAVTSLTEALAATGRLRTVESGVW